MPHNGEQVQRQWGAAIPDSQLLLPEQSLAAGMQTQEPCLKCWAGAAAVPGRGLAETGALQQALQHAAGSRCPAVYAE